MPFALIFEQFWRWIADTGINLALLVVLATLVPRAGRLANRWIERRVNETQDTDGGKSSLAIAGVGIYIVQIVAYFLILVFFLQQIGFSLAGAAIPATVVSAAVGFGAQQIIADFFAGFFILTEKQYGVGDLVTFQGNGIDVTGTVIQITMRSTQVRTIEEYTVTIPNSTAQICINNSNHWSRALQVVSVPLLKSSDTEEVIARANNAARRAIEDPEIAPLVRGELIAQPGLKLNPPATVGMPWTLDIRYMIRCSPGDQFPIERAINVYVLEEFFDEYGSATTVGGKLVDTLDDARTSAFAPPFTAKRYSSDWEFESEPNVEDGVYMPASSATKIDDSGTSGQELSSDPAEPDPENDPAAQDAPDHKIGSFGGRVRASTGVLIALFFILLIFRGLTLSSSAESSKEGGVLAPPPVSPESVAPAPSVTDEPVTPTTSTPGPTTEPSHRPTPEHTEQQQQQPAPPTREQAPQEQPSPEVDSGTTPTEGVEPTGNAEQDPLAQ